MNQNRIQHLVPGGLVFALAVLVAWLSFTREPSEAFLFPRLIASVMLVLATWNFARAALGLARVGTGLSPDIFRAILPGVVIMLIQVFFAAKMFGFYASSLVMFVILFAVYDPAPHNEVKSWIKRFVIATAFMAIIYGLFALLLRVQTPRGLLF